MILRKLKILIDYIFSNKFWISSAAFLFWMLFVDGDKLIDRYFLWQDIRQLEQERTKYEGLIQEDQKRLYELSTNHFSLEKVAREKYFMHKSNEMVFVMTEKEAED